MVVVVIIGILVALGTRSFSDFIRVGNAKAAEPYLMALAAKLRANQNSLGVWMNNQNIYTGGGTLGGITYTSYDEQFLEDFLGVDLKDAADFCFMVNFNVGDFITPTGLAAGTVFEIWAVLRDTAVTPENDPVVVRFGGRTCVTANAKLPATGWVGTDSGLPGGNGRVVALRYPPPNDAPQDVQRTDANGNPITIFDWQNGMTISDVLL